MPAQSPALLYRQEFETAKLVAEFPPRFRNRNKQLVQEIACPPGAAQAGRLVVTRWPTMPLPERLPEGGPETAFEARPDVFGYERVPGDAPRVEWYLNFACSDLFCAYAGPLFAQDEMQVTEHPALGSLREALLHHQLSTWTVDRGEPTPILITGVERRCRVATDANPAEGRPFGLYGNQFAQAAVEAIRKATTAIVPPTRTNLIAIEAPPYGQGAYSQKEIEIILRTAYSGFRAAREESEEAATRPKEVVIHTGYWGCGAYGGNRILMTLLQLLAARLSQVHRLVFHAVRASGLAPFERAKQHFIELARPAESLASVIQKFEALRLEWGVSDGN